MSAQQRQLPLFFNDSVVTSDRQGGICFMQEQLSFNDRLLRSSIVTVRENESVYLEHGGKRIERPHVIDIEELAQQHFGLTI